MGTFSFKTWKDLANAEMEWQDLQQLKRQQEEDEGKNQKNGVKIEKSPIKVIPVAEEDVKPADESLAKIDSVHELIEDPVIEPAPERTEATAAIEGTRFLFNSDITCDHGNLTTDKSACRTVPYHVWRTFAKYFKNAAEFKDSQPVCPICRVRVSCFHVSVCVCLIA